MTGIRAGAELPRISIVTPSYNQARYLESAMLSVLGQDHPNVEYIVMDGGSEDGSLEIIRRHEGRLAHWRSGKDKGQADAIYQGFRMATGDILGWLNSDDVLLAGSLGKVAAYFSTHPKTECVVGGSVFFDGDGRLVWRKTRICGFPVRHPFFNLGARQSFTKMLFWECGGFCQPASFWRREAFFEVGGFDTDLAFCFDYDMYLRLARRRRFGRIRDFLAGFRLHGESKSSTIQDVWKREKVEVLARHGKFDHPAIVRSTMRSCLWNRQKLSNWADILKWKLGMIRLPDLDSITVGPALNNGR